MQIPMLTAKGDATITAGVSKDGNNTGWEVLGIYSPLPHVGLMLQHFNLHYKGDSYNDFSPFTFPLDFNGQTRLTEAALGGYYQVGPHKEYLLSLFSGFGQGKTQNEYMPTLDMQSPEVYKSEWRYRRYFIQPALGLTSRRLQVGTGLRFVWINYFDGDINSRVGLRETERILLMESASPIFLTEMAWSIGWRWRPMVISLNSTAVVRGKNELRDLQLASNYVSLTVGLNLHELKKK